MNGSASSAPDSMNTVAAVVKTELDTVSHSEVVEALVSVVLDTVVK
jgi:hypothetical protein